MECEDCVHQGQRSDEVCARCRHDYSADLTTKSAAALVLACVSALVALLTYGVHDVASFAAFLLALFSCFYVATTLEHLRQLALGWRR